ncbi:putative acid phosphatase 5 [Astathelohania contejeani]|uniref:Acid phosphatase 5 n=1 Tax=Astathelohania contejeani TaxID=164912 RepID=A0ABQ7HYN5_9MICR|nr:putative acid phosphatase 5 [Thelohania contejeani]
MSRWIDAKILGNIPRLKIFKKYCESDYSPVPQKNNLKLSKVIVIHRHGDRTPIEMVGREWEQIKCVRCKLTGDMLDQCTIQACKNGELTAKGYQQMQELGKYIKKEYGKKLKFTLDNIKLRATAVGRTHASLHGVLVGLADILKLNNVDVNRNSGDSLLNPRKCRKLLTPMEPQLNVLSDGIPGDKKEFENISPSRKTDIYLTHICNDVDLNCNNLNCDEKLIEKYIKLSLDTWRSESEMAIRNESILKILFGRFARDLLIYLEDTDKKLYIISAHDGSLANILIGLGTSVVDHPPYASAIFLELWENKKEKFIRVLFNNRVCQTTIDESTNIPLTKFKNYLKVLAIDNSELDNICETM